MLIVQDYAGLLASGLAVALLWHVLDMSRAVGLANILPAPRKMGTKPFGVSLYLGSALLFSATLVASLHFRTSDGAAMYMLMASAFLWAPAATLTLDESNGRLVSIQTELLLSISFLFALLALMALQESSSLLADATISQGSRFIFFTPPQVFVGLMFASLLVYEAGRSRGAQRWRPGIAAAASNRDLLGITLWLALELRLWGLCLFAVWTFFGIGSSEFSLLMWLAKSAAVFVSIRFLAASAWHVDEAEALNTLRSIIAPGFAIGLILTLFWGTYIA